MAKEKTESKEERRARKEAKKAAKPSEKAGVSKAEKKSSKKDREILAEKALNEIEAADDSETEIKTSRPIGALVPFAHPLADEKIGKKCFKAVKKARVCVYVFAAAAQRTLKRGVKEVVKALRKSPNSGPSNSLSADSIPLGIVILAADISPMDVISHIPVLCEDHNIPYIFVTSRAELGMAGQTKRPTSVTMVKGMGAMGDGTGEQRRRALGQAK
ncbi:hypothetical protein DV737_g3412, partial [Chaetothyriales sp. CBS 132003]